MLLMLLVLQFNLFGLIESANCFIDGSRYMFLKGNGHFKGVGEGVPFFNYKYMYKIFLKERLKTHFSAYMRRVAFIITSDKHTLCLFLTPKNSLI